MLFQSTPPAEARGDLPESVTVASPVKVSIHSPRRSEGRQLVSRTRSSRSTSFNPLPPPKRGETDRHRNGGQLKEFQSTPPAEARGDVDPRDSPRRIRRFQSTPPAEARGDGVRNGPSASALSVSIHSPRRSEGRR